MLRRIIARNDWRALERVATRLVSKAAAGDISAIKEIADRLDGKAPQDLNLKGDPSAPLRLNLNGSDVDG